MKRPWIVFPLEFRPAHGRSGPQETDHSLNSPQSRHRICTRLCAGAINQSCSLLIEYVTQILMLQTFSHSMTGIPVGASLSPAACFRQFCHDVSWVGLQVCAFAQVLAPAITSRVSIAPFHMVPPHRLKQCERLMSCSDPAIGLAMARMTARDRAGERCLHRKTFLSTPNLRTGWRDPEFRGGLATPCQFNYDVGQCPALV